MRDVVTYMHDDLCAVTESDLENAWEDMYGVIYSADKKKLLKVSNKFKHTYSYIIPEGTEVICDNAFYDCRRLTQVTFCNTLKMIGDNAFNCCFQLKMAMLPDSIQQIGSCAFEFCQEMRYIKLPKDITIIRDYTFSGCAVITEIEFPKGITFICNRAFQACLKLQLSGFPAKLEYIGERAFYFCRSLGYFDFNEGLKEIGKEAFLYAHFCDGMIDSFGGDSGYVEIPKSVEKIGDDAFSESDIIQLKVHKSTQVGSQSFGYKKENSSKVLVFVD